MSRRDGSSNKIRNTQNLSTETTQKNLRINIQTICQNDILLKFEKA